MLHQAGPKSSVYKSFITCEDPKGVVDCSLIMRRSKSNGGSQIMHHQKNVENVRISRSSTSRSPSLDLASQHEDQLRSSTSSFRLMEVSRGSQRLNYTIDSWSNEEKNIFDDHGRSKHIAKDLLKGALDLQESLVMLGKLQEASQYMNTLNKKHERAYPRPSDGYSPRNSSEEMKKVIRDSLVRQKFSANTEKGYAYSYSESTPSTSSSQSSLHQNTSEHSSASSQKVKSSPSLIAKLMGMEADYPLKYLQENEKVSCPQRPAFEIARPKVRRFQTAEKRTLKEVLDAMRFKGLLRSNSFEEAKFDIDHNSHLEMEKNFNGDDSPPIVLMKPIYVESAEMEVKAPIVRGEEAFYNRRMLRKLRSNEEVSTKTISGKERSLKSNKVQQKLEVEVTPYRKISKEEGAKKQRGELRKDGEGESKMKEMGARKLKASQHVLHKPQKEATDMRVDKVQKAKAKTVSKNKSEDLEKLTLAKGRRPESGSNTTTKTRISRQPSNVISTSSKRSTAQNAESVSSERRRNQLRKEQPFKEPKRLESVTKIVVSEEVDRRSNISESSLISSNTDAAVNLIKEEEMKAYESQSEGCCNSLLNSIAEATSLSSMQENNSENAEVVSEDISRIGMNEKSVDHGDNLGEFLLSNATFLSHAAELFSLDSNVSTFSQPPSISKSVMCSTRLVLDCANELAECKSSRLSQTVSPLSLLTILGKPRARISLEKLVEDVCNGIERLRRHSKLAGDESLIADSMHSILERDIMCNGRWDIGWRYGFSSDEADQVVCDVERLVFQGLIEEVFA